MKSILYSPVFSEKIELLLSRLKIQFGENVCKKKIKELYDAINLLSLNEHMGISVREVYGVDCDFYCIYAVHNYVFYKIELSSINILDIYDEREDFMKKMFGI